MPRSRTTFAAPLAAMLMLFAASTSGCGSGKPRTIDAALDAPVVYVGRGYWVGADAREVVAIADAERRLAEWDRRAVKLDGGFVVPPATFEWLLKYAARARRAAAAEP